MKCTKAIISTMLSVIFLLWGGTFVVHAKEPVYVQETEETSLVGANGLSLSVNYPSDIKCGVPITFTMNAGGGSGNYKYRIAGLMDSERNNVYDISFGSNGAYKTSNTFTFTFFASGTYYIRFSVMDMSTYQTLMTGMFDYPIVINDASHPSVETIVNSVAAQCEAVCQTDYEKALWLHDWIIDNADYDFSYSYCSAEGVLARGVGTCESYHGAYVKLLNRVGIETGRITGNGHVWTAVKLDGEWYQVDTTWDDKGAQFQGTFYEHLYFGVNDAIISLVHDEHQNPKPGYESTSLKNNYFIKTGQIKQWSDPFLDTIRQNIAAGQTEFRIPVTDSLHDSYKNVIYNLVAYQLSQENWNEKDVTVTYAERQLTCSVTNKENAGAGSTPGAGNNAGTGSTPGADNNAGTGSAPGADNNAGT
ncbi:MAG: transglutaminase domain-containing protein, partial [Clostridiales bacterium]|nr:transglutaminase domain-containing protein [Clostridiales bacterium]